MQCRGEGDETKIKCKFRKAAIHISVFFCCDNWRIKFIIIFLKSCYLCVALQKERWLWKVRLYIYPRFKENSEEEEPLHRSVAGGRRLGRHGFYLKMLMMMVDCCVYMCGGYNKLPSPSDV